MNKKYLILVGIVAAIVLTTSSYVSFLIGKNTASIELSKIQNLASPELDPLIYMINILIRGKITSVNDGVATVESNNGAKANIEIRQSPSIWKPGVPKAFNSLQDIELNRQAIIQIQSNDGILKIGSISYMANKPPPNK